MTAARYVQPGSSGGWARVRRQLERILSDDSGQDLIEYALIFSFVALGAIACTKSLSTSIAAVFASIGTILTTAT